MAPGFLVFFIYGNLGMQFFGGIQHGAVIPRQCYPLASRYTMSLRFGDPLCQGWEPDKINDIDNFDNIRNAIRLLFQVSTGEDFVILMQPINASPAGGRGTFVFFSSFYVIVVFTMLNMFVVVLLENFEMSYEAEDVSITVEVVENYKASWIRCSEAPTNKFVKASDIGKLVTKLEGTLGQVRDVDSHCVARLA